MGTNYYAKIIPTRERKKGLHDAIDADDFSLVQKLVDEMYGNLSLDYCDTSSLTGGVVHLGKRSGGWKFLWNPNVYVVRNGHSEWTETPGGRSSRWIPEPDTPLYLYPLTKEGIKAFIDREDVVIYDEYGEKQDKEEFWDMAINWTTWQGKEAYDSGIYEAEHPSTIYKMDTDLTKLLYKEGYRFISDSQTDFYSDGLRFSTSTDFS